MSQCVRKHPAMRGVGMMGSGALLLFFVVLGGCADSTPPPLATDVPELQLTALPPIGSDTGDGPNVFGDIADIEIGEDGAIYVLDRTNAEIRVFDRSGTHLRTMGGPGSGPGEFQGPVALTWGPEGGLWVVDFDNARYTVYAPDGRLIGTHPREVQGLWLPWPGGFSPDGHLYDVAHMPGRGIELIESVLVDGELVQTRRRELPWRPTVFEVQGAGLIQLEIVPFSAQPMIRIGPDGQLWHAQSGPWVYRQSPFGGQESRLGRDFAAPVVTRSERQQVLRAERYDMLRTIGQETFQDFVERIPERKPHLRGFFLDDASNVWVMRTPSNQPDDSLPSIDIYDAEGNLTAVAETTFEPRPWPRVRNGLVAGVVRDEVGVEFVALYEIE